VSRRIARDTDVIDVFDSNAGDVETITDRRDRKSRAVLDPVESFFFDGGYELAISNDRRGGVSVISVNS